MCIRDSCFAVTAVSLGIKTDDAFSFGEESNSGHDLDGDLADLNLGIRLTMTLTLVVALLGLVLVDADLLALAVLDDGGLCLLYTSRCV